MKVMSMMLTAMTRTKAIIMTRMTMIIVAFGWIDDTKRPL